MSVVSGIIEHVFETGSMARASDALEHVRALGHQAVAVADEARSAGVWPARDVAEALAIIDRVTGALATAKAHLLVAQREAGGGMRVGDRSFESARARATRQGLGEVWREVRQADTLVAMPDVADAVAEGAIPMAHLDALAKQAANASGAVDELLRSPDGQAHVVAMARQRTAPEFSRELAAWVATHDPAKLERDFQAQRRERFLILTQRPEGTFLKGRFDPIAGHELRLALESTGQVPGPDRSWQQADADALAALARHGLGCGRPSGTAVGQAGQATAGQARAGQALPTGTALVDAAGLGVDARERLTGVSNRPHVSLLLPIETLAALRAHRCRTDDWSFAWEPVAPATLEDGTPVTWSELARLLCDCEVTRIALDAEGEPVDLGRTKRLYEAAQRRAVIARDRQCVWNGCRAEARWCEVHHMRWWERDGSETSVANGCLLCEFHHHEVHRLDLSIERLTQPRAVSGLSPGDGCAAGPSPGGTRSGSTLRRGGMPGPARYVFRARDGRVVNEPDELAAPPAVAGTPLTTPTRPAPVASGTRPAPEASDLPLPAPARPAPAGGVRPPRGSPPPTRPPTRGDANGPGGQAQRQPALFEPP